MNEDAGLDEDGEYIHPIFPWPHAFLIVIFLMGCFVGFGFGAYSGVILGRSRERSERLDRGHAIQEQVEFWHQYANAGDPKLRIVVVP